MEERFGFPPLSTYKPLHSSDKGIFLCYKQKLVDNHQENSNLRQIIERTSVNFLTFLTQILKRLLLNDVLEI